MKLFLNYCIWLTINITGDKLRSQSWVFDLLFLVNRIDRGLHALKRWDLKFWLKFIIFRIFPQNTWQVPFWCALLCVYSKASFNVWHLNSRAKFQIFSFLLGSLSTMTDWSYNSGQSSLGQWRSIHNFLSFLASLIKQCFLFEKFLQFSLTHPIQCWISEKKIVDTHVQRCSWGGGKGWECVNWKKPHK